MGVTVAQKKSRLFPVAFLAAKATLAALKLTNHEGGTLPGFIAEGIDPAFLGDIAKPEQIVFITGTNGKTTTNNLLNDLRPLPTALAAIFPAALQARLQRTPRGRARQRLSLRLWSLTSSLDLAFSLTCSLIFCPLLICSAIRFLVVQLQTTCLTLWIRAFLLQLI